MKAAAIQLDAGMDKARNVRTAVKMVETAAEAGAELIVLPEVFLYRGTLSSGELRSVAESLHGPTMQTMRALARTRKIWLVAGSVYEKRHGHRKLYNTSVLIGPDGKIAARYRKKNLFDALIGDKQVKESHIFSPGLRKATARVGDFKLGLSICYDLRFADIYRREKNRGCDIFTVPSCFTRKTGEAHWEVLLRARAIENLCYIIAPNQAGRDGRGIPSFGNSMIISPWGKILARASGAGPEIIYARINRGELELARQTLPGIV